MKVLIICSGNAGYISPFILEQSDAIRDLEIDVQLFTVIGKGILGYSKNLPLIKNKIEEFKPDIVHAHYGLSGLVSCMQRKVPVVITFHGSDAYINYVKLLSKIAARLSSFNIFVEAKIQKRLKGHNKDEIIQCGVNLYVFYPMNKDIARERIGLVQGNKYILFSSNFDNRVKNYSLAKASLDLLNNDLILIELKNKTREEVNLLLNACDIALLTSISEGSPQFIKEAMACNCPIVSTDVGDVKEIIDNTEGCYITSFDPNDVAEKIQLALKFSERTNGREKILHFDNKIISKKIINIYTKVLNVYN